MKPNARTMAAVAAVFTAAAVLAAAMAWLALRNAGRTVPFGGLLAAQLLSWHLWTLLTPAILALGRAIDCEVLTPDDLYAAIVDPSQIHQVFSNIIMNAVQAMPGGGRLVDGQRFAARPGRQQPETDRDRHPHVCG